MRPLEYSSIIWSPYYKNGINKIEAVHKVVKKAIGNLRSFKYSERLKYLTWIAYNFVFYICSYVYECKFELGLMNEKQTNTHTNKQTNKQTNKWLCNYWRLFDLTNVTITDCIDNGGIGDSMHNEQGELKTQMYINNWGQAN